VIMRTPRSRGGGVDLSGIKDTGGTFTAPVSLTMGGQITDVLMDAREQESGGRAGRISICPVSKIPGVHSQHLSANLQTLLRVGHG